MAEPYKRPPDSLAHHVEVDGSAPPDDRSDPLSRYLRQLDGRWFFSERKLMVDWTETRVLNAE